MKNKKIVFVLTLLVGICACDLNNPIMEKWWVEGELEDPFYVPIIKTLPPETIYKTITETEYIYKTIYDRLPPEVIIQYVPQYFYEEITRDPTPEEIQEFITHLPPEYIFQYLTDEQKQYIETLLPPNVVIEDVPQYIKETEYEEVYKYIYETEYQTIYETITRDPTPEEIQEFIKQLLPETIFQYLTNDQIEYIKSQIPPEIYIQQLPPQILLQSISIVDIEYIIFSGDATAYNVNSPTSGGTSLTTQEKATNDDIVNVMAQMLQDKSYMLILHGHANPVTGTAAEAVQLTQISLDRANAVSGKIKSINTDPSLDDRITTKGYGGVRNVSTTGSSPTSSLNRRVEAILFTIATTPMSGGN